MWNKIWYAVRTSRLTAFWPPSLEQKIKLVSNCIGLHLWKIKMFENLLYKGLIRDLLVFISVLITCYQTTKLLTSRNQYNQDRIVNFDKQKGIAVCMWNKIWYPVRISRFTEFWPPLLEQKIKVVSNCIGLQLWKIEMFENLLYKGLIRDLLVFISFW